MDRIIKIAIGLAFVIGTVLTFWGLGHLQWPQALPWAGKDAMTRYIGWITVCVFLIISCSWWTKRNPLVVGSAVAIGMALLSGTLWPLFVTLWFAVASLISGRLMLRILRIGSERDNWWAGFLVGAGVYGTAVGLFAHFPINYPGVYGVALVLPIVIGWRMTIDDGRRFLAVVAQKDDAGFRINWLDVAIAAVALIYFVVALMPEVGYDALAMHMFIPAHIALRHQWGFDVTTYVWAVTPLLGDWLFSLGYMLGGETASRFMNVGFILVLCWLVRDLTLWAGGNLAGARLAVLVLLSTPLTFTEGSSLFVESVWTSFVVAGTLSVLRVTATPANQESDLPIAGILLGCAMAIKISTVPYLIALMVFILLRNRFFISRSVAGHAFIGIVLFAVFACSPYVVAGWKTGNPAFPFFNHIFKSSLYYTENQVNPLFRTPINWDFLYILNFDSIRFLESKNGVAGFQWLILFPATVIVLIANRLKRAGEVVVIAVIALVVAFKYQSYLRYVFPTWAMIASSIGVAVIMIDKRAFWGKLVIFLVAAVVVLNLLFLNAGSFYSDFKLGSGMDRSNKERYLLSRIPTRSAVELVNQLNVDRSPVAIFAQPFTAGLSADALHFNWYNHRFFEAIYNAQTEQAVAGILLKRGVNFIILDSGWSGVAEKQALLVNSTDKIAEYGTVSVRKVKTDFRFKSEMLTNPDFKSIDGWSLAPEVKYDAAAGSVLVNVSSSATQVVGVTSGQRYLNTVTARCAKEKTLGRVQINWLDGKGQFITTDIKTFECSDSWNEHSMEVIAPPKAANAIVYVTGHTSVPLEFKGNSLRQ